MAINKGVRKWLLITVSVGITVNVISRIHLATGAPYKTAKQFLETNPVVIEKLGEVKSSSPSFFDPAEVELGSSNNDAMMTVKLNGSTVSAKAHVRLKQKGDTWEVIAATLKMPDGFEADLLRSN